MAEEKKVSIFNRGIRTFKLPHPSGSVIVIPPGKAVDVPESVSLKYAGPKGYRELVDAASMSPATVKRNAALEEENARLKARIAELEALKDPKDVKDPKDAKEPKEPKGK